MYIGSLEDRKDLGFAANKDIERVQFVRNVTLTHSLTT